MQLDLVNCEERKNKLEQEVASLLKYADQQQKDEQDSEGKESTKETTAAGEREQWTRYAHSLSDENSQLHAQVAELTQQLAGAIEPEYSGGPTSMLDEELEQWTRYAHDLSDENSKLQAEMSKLQEQALLSNSATGEQSNQEQQKLESTSLMQQLEAQKSPVTTGNSEVRLDENDCCKAYD